MSSLTGLSALYNLYQSNTSYIGLDADAINYFTSIRSSLTRTISPTPSSWTRLALKLHTYWRQSAVMWWPETIENEGLLCLQLTTDETTRGGEKREEREMNLSRLPMRVKNTTEWRVTGCKYITGSPRQPKPSASERCATSKCSLRGSEQAALRST